MKVLVVGSQDVSRWLRGKMAAYPNTVTVERIPDLPHVIPALQRIKPHAVILGLRLPSGSGLGMIQQIKELLPSVTILMFTSSTDLLTHKAARDLGASYVFHKGNGSAKLVETLGKLAARWSTARPIPTSPNAQTQLTAESNRTDRYRKRPV